VSEWKEINLMIRFLQTKCGSFSKSCGNVISLFTQIIYALDYLAGIKYININKTRHGMPSGTAPGRVVFLLPSGGKTDA